MYYNGYLEKLFFFTKKTPMKITIYGSGFVGLITGACFAQAGNDVLIVDTNTKKTDAIQRGELSFYEPSLEHVIRENITMGRLSFSSSHKDGVEHGVYQFIAVGTPIDNHGASDTSNIINTAKSIAKYMSCYRIIVSKSTAPVGDEVPYRPYADTTNLYVFAANVEAVSMLKVVVPVVPHSFANFP